MAQKHTNTTANEIFAASMSDALFNQLSRHIESITGIKMPINKKTMLEGRLRRRVRALGFTSFKEYTEHVFNSSEGSDENVHLLDAVTTNKTDFFREPTHFDYLSSTVLPEFMGAQGKVSRKNLRIWSAGCSTGEEPYTLAMVLSEFAQQYKDFNFSILATDLSTEVLRKAINAVYDTQKVAPVSTALKKKYLLRSRNSSEDVVRIVPELRNKVTFGRLNFMQPDFGIKESMDVIFCRNVIIYFDRQTQEKLLNQFCRHLVPGGYVFMGHSETLTGLNVPLDQVGPTIYRLQ
ncbi:MAG: protein-glutamate O-methyltransferase [Deltaproteobacteria bacterium]|nr:protein-glutamate O-methyltransferase [Deltaproteobacteria bacterium]